MKAIGGRTASRRVWRGRHTLRVGKTVLKTFLIQFLNSRVSLGLKVQIFYMCPNKHVALQSHGPHFMVPYAEQVEKIVLPYSETNLGTSKILFRL